MGRSWSARWNRLKPELSLADLMTDVIGKVLVALGLGTLLASLLREFAGWLIGIGLALSLSVKAKHWKRFWS